MPDILRLRYACIGTVACLVAAPLPAQEVEISGLFFGDYYAAVGHHDEEVEDLNGFWARRMYLTVDFDFESNFDSRIRFEAASPGDFTTATTMDPFLKDLWVRWRSGNHGILVGLSPSPTWNALEREWGYRFVEKTPLDLYKYGSSRDFGVAFLGSFDEERRVRYHVMLANGSGTKGETNAGKKVMASLAFHPDEHLVFEAYADHEERPEEKDRDTFTGFAVAKGSAGRVGFMAARQVRSTPGEPDLELDLFSVFGVLDVDERVNLVARWDHLLDPVPDGDRISYFRLDPTSELDFLLVGADVELAEGVHIMPNLEVVTYDAEALDTDVFLKTTFFITF